MIKIEFKTDNVCFEGDDLQAIEDTFAYIMRQLRRGKDNGKVMDYNGNSIGTFEYTKEKV